jgi:aspartate/methionine/tyrosine aminotransferase
METRISPMPHRFADRMNSLQSNVFADMDRAKREAIAQGQALIDLSLGSSDLPTPPHIFAPRSQNAWLFIV